MTAKQIYILLLVIIPGYAGIAQSLSGPETVNSYSVAQKRLLLNNTFQFINWKTQNSLDADSLMFIALRITDLPFLLPYIEGSDDTPSISAGLINDPKISGAKQALNTIEDERRNRLLLELGIWYLHQLGNHGNDLDSAEHYISLASVIASSHKDRNLLFNCQALLAEMDYQRGSVNESRKIYYGLPISGEKEGNLQKLAITCQHPGSLLPDKDSMKLFYFNKALQLYQQLQLKEKEIEQLWEIEHLYMNNNKAVVPNYLLRMLDLEKNTGFKHVLFTKFMLIFAYENLNNYSTPLDFANTALANTKWSEINEVEPECLIRMGAVYEELGKDTEAMRCFRKAIEGRYSSPEICWYNGFFATALLAETYQTARLSLMDSITKEFPPITIWDKMQLFSINRQCYTALHYYKLAGENYSVFYKLIIQFPEADPYMRYRGPSQIIAAFYVSQKNLKKARLFLNVEFSDTTRLIEGLTYYQRYSVLYKIDSIRGDYEPVLQNHIRFKYYFDLNTNMNQRKKLDELTVKYAAEKRDEDIKLLMQQGIVKQAELKQNKLARNITLAGIVLLIIMIGFLFNQYLVKPRTNRAINKKNNALNKLVTEKDWLLKEVYYRVKNNLQTVVSLLELQSDFLNNGAQLAIHDSQNRIYAMSLIHQKLYQSDNIASINMHSYLQQLTCHLREIYSRGRPINFEITAVEIELDVSRAVPVGGLIVNESVTNCLKYAFASEISNLTITIGLEKNAIGQLVLPIAVNGSGLPANFLKEDKAGLGFKLMKGTVEHIEVQLTIETLTGTQIGACFNAGIPFLKTNDVMGPGESVAA